MRVTPETETRMFPLVRPNWPTQQRSPAWARAAYSPATPLEATAADVLAWDRERGEPPISRGYTAQEEEALLARTAAWNPGTRSGAER